MRAGPLTRSMTKTVLASPKNILLKGLQDKSIELIQEAKDKGANLEEALLEAVLFGKNEDIPLLCQAGADKNYRRVGGGSLLHCAVLIGNTSVVQTLITAGFDVNAIDANLWTPLHMAGHAGIADLLVKAGANITARSINGYMPIFFAVQRENKELFDYFLSMDMNLYDSYPLKFYLTEAACSSEFFAYVKQRIGVGTENLKKLREIFLDLLNKEFKYATQKRKKLLIILGESHNQFNIEQMKLEIYSAAVSVGIRMFFVELPRGKEVLDPMGSYVLERVKNNQAVFKGIDNHPERNKLATVSERNAVMAQELNQENEHAILILGAAHLKGMLSDPAARIDREKYHIVPINFASCSRAKDKFFEYLERKLPFDDCYGIFFANPQYVIQILENFSLSDPEQVVSYWNTRRSTIEAEIEGQMPEFYLDVNECQKDPMGLLVTGLVHELVDLIKLAQNAGVNLDEVLISSSFLGNCQNNIRLLCQAGANVNSFLNGVTALHTAILKGHLDIVKVLVEEVGAKIDALAINGQTPLDIAKEQKNEEMINYLTLRMQTMSDIQKVTNAPNILNGYNLRRRNNNMPKIAIKQFSASI